MNFGVIRENPACDRRVALTPPVVRRLVEAGHTVWVESGAGAGAMYGDQDYLSAGAQLAYSPAEAIQRADLVAKVSVPTVEQLKLCRPGIVVMAFYHMAVADRGVFQTLIEGKITAVGCEIIQTDDGTLPALAPISAIAGQMTVPIAAHLLRSSSGGRGILLGGSPGVPPAHVVVLGAGNVGSAAARAAAGSGARVTVLDVDPEKLRRLLEHVPQVGTCAGGERFDRRRRGLGGRADRRRAGGRHPHAARGHPRHGGENEARLGHPGRLHRPGRLRRNQPAHHHRRPHIRLPRGDPLLRAQLHGGPGARRQRGDCAGHAAVSAGHRARGHRRGHRAAPGPGPRALHAPRRLRQPETRGGVARMMSDYRSRVTTADQALETVASGQRVYIHQGCAEPEELVRALTRRGPALRDVEVIHLATFGNADYTLPQYEGHFRHTAFFIGGNVRRAVQEGRADYIPIFLSEVEELFRSGAMPIDVALMQCTPPDDYGYMSLGPSIDCSLTAAQQARHVIVEINDQMPRTMGDAFLHVSRVDAFIEASHPLPEYRSGEVTDLHRAIARNVAGMIPDGATLQMGIGGIPDAVLGFLRDRQDLGIHSEMISDGVVELIRAGVINNEKKGIHPNKVIAGFALGTKALFDFLNENPIFEFHPTAYVNDPFVIAQNNCMVAINSAIEVDLTGQVCSDSMGATLYSGIGGQVDFIRGAARSKGGLPIIALPSTAKDGKVSRIVPTLQPGAGVVTSRGDVHYVVTEYGVAYLHGKSIRQRAEALIAIAHPDFREQLLAYARQNRLMSARAASV